MTFRPEFNAPWTGQPHVTLRLLWVEWKADHPDGWTYSQFCHHLEQQQSEKGKPSMVLEHGPAVSTTRIAEELYRFER